MANANTLYDLTFTTNRGEEVALSDYAGKPVLIVNTASKCGFTPQYQGLQELHEEFKDEGSCRPRLPVRPVRRPGAR